MPDYLIIMPNWIGDVFMALSVIQRKVEKEGLKPLLLVMENMQELVHKLTRLPTLAYDRHSSESVNKAINIIKAHDFSKVYLLTLSMRTAWISLKTGIPYRRGIDREGRGILLTDSLPKSVRNKQDHLIREYSVVLETDYQPPHQWQSNYKYKENRFESRYDVVLCPGAKYGPAKQWPYYTDLAKELAPLNIAVLGTKDDNEVGAKIQSASPQNVTNLAGRTNLLQVADIISNSRIVVSNDSGLMHLAAYLDTPVLGLFGSTSPRWTRPIGENASVITNNIECSPCFKKECPFEHYKCMTTIQSTIVAQKVKSIVYKSPASKSMTKGMLE